MAEHTKASELTEEEQCRRVLEVRQKEHQQMCIQALAQARSACAKLSQVQSDLDQGRLTCRENCPDEVHRLFSIPDTTVEIQDLIFSETPLVVRTCGPHRFKTGQIVILTGIKAKTGAPSQLQGLVEGLSQDQAMAWVDDCRFALSSVSQLPCSEETARDYIDFSGAQVALSVSTWALRHGSITLSVLLSLSNAASASGLGHVAGKGWAGLCVIGDSLRSVADSSACQVEQRQQTLGPGRWADGLSWIQGGLRSASDLRAPDLPHALTTLWGRCVEFAQPASWNASLKAASCEECIQPFGAGLGSTHDTSKHHCRHCGRVICDACSKDRLCVPWEGHSKSVRVCKACKEVVEVRNHALQVYDTLSERIRLVRRGHILQPKKGAGKGPPLPKGKGKGKAKEPSRGLGALASDVKPGLGDWVDLERPDIKFTRQKMPPPSQSAHNKEALFLRVAMQGCKHHLTEIEDALKNVTLEGAKNVDSWFEAVDQIMPLEDKFSSSFLECLKDVPEDALGEVTQDQRHLRQLFFGVRSSLQLRWRALRLLHELVNPQELYWKPIFAAQRAIDLTLDSGSSSSSTDSTVDSSSAGSTGSESFPQLRDEVKNLVALLFRLSGGKYDKLPELAERTQVGKTGLQLFSRAWETGMTQNLCDVKALLETLRPVLEDESLGSLHVALGDFQAKNQELRQLGELNAAALAHLEGIMKEVEQGLLEVLESGKLMLSAFGVKVSEGCPARALAIDVDLHLESLRVLLDGLKKADPTPVAPRRAKVERTSGQTPVPRSGKGKPTRWRRPPKSKQANAPPQASQTPEAPGRLFHDESDETQDEAETQDKAQPPQPPAIGSELSDDAHEVAVAIQILSRGEGVATVEAP